MEFALKYFKRNVKSLVFLQITIIGDKMKETMNFVENLSWKLSSEDFLRKKILFLVLFLTKFRWLVNLLQKFQRFFNNFEIKSQNSVKVYLQSPPFKSHQIISPQRKTLKSINFSTRRREKHEQIFQNGRNWNSSRERIIRLYAVLERKFALKVYCGDNELALDSYLPQKDHSLESNECTLHAQQR